MTDDRHRQKPYVAKLQTIGKFTAWLIDGDWVRKHYDVDFNDYATGRTSSTIPFDELWIEQSLTHEEQEHALGLALNEATLGKQSAKSLANQTRLLEAWRGPQLKQRKYGPVEEINL